MKIIYGDFETYYSEEYTLDMRKSVGITAIEYILDPRYETIMCAIAVENEPPFILERDKVADFLRGIKEPYAFASHNATFDAAILAYRYEIHPAILIDTLSMCRAMLNYKLRSLRLADVLNYYGLEAKGSTIKDVKGMRTDEIKANGLWDSFSYYCRRDCIGVRDIYLRLNPLMSAREMRIIDTVIRMVTQPRLQLNIDKLRVYHQQILEHKENLLEPLNITSRSQLQSNQQFAELLKALDVDPPMKRSPTTGELTYAFAKTDNDFMALLEHPDERVQQLMEARLGIKTTIEETRTSRFINIAQTTINSWGTALLPVPLKYSGAHTHRLSGDWKLNLQNLSSRKQTTLREAIEAPPDHYIIAVDAKQIEARLTAWLAEERDLLRAFREERDIYSEFAARIYNKPLIMINKVERFTGKTIILGLGFGMSAKKLLYTLINAAREQKYDEKYTIEETEAWVNIYRSTYARINDLWKLAQGILKHMIRGIDGQVIGPCRVEGQSIILPSGLRLRYHNIHEDEEGGNFSYEYGGRWRKIYGAKMVENVVQALDRQYVMEAALRTESRCRREGIEAKIVLQLHDENVYCVHREHAKRVTMIAYEEMSRSPDWGPDFPAAAEVKAGRNYAHLWEMKLPKIQNQVSADQKISEKTT